MQPRDGKGRRHRPHDTKDEGQVGRVVVRERARVVERTPVAAHHRVGEQGECARHDQGSLDNGTNGSRHGAGDQHADDQDKRREEQIVKERAADDEPGQVRRSGVDLVLQ